MIPPHVRSICWSSLVLLIIFSFSNAVAQVSDSEVERGIALYEKREYQQAKDLLQSAVKHRKDDLIAWHYLGLALEGLSKKSDARKAHERAAKLGESLLLARLRSIDSADPLAPLLPMSAHLAYAARSTSEFIAMSPNLSGLDFEEWTNRAISLQDFAEILEPDGADREAKKIFSRNQVTTKVRILSKNEPLYTDEARQNQTTGIVILLAILAADGKVRGIVPIKVLPHGLTGASVRVARQMTFVPAMIGGRPVSMILRIEYHFNVF